MPLEIRFRIKAYERGQITMSTGPLIGMKKPENKRSLKNLKSLKGRKNVKNKENRGFLAEQLPARINSILP